MATEPTLGTRILDAVTAWSIAVQDQSEAIDGDSWEDSYDASVNEGMATLRALAARADAAERLAKARRVAVDADDAWETLSGEGGEDGRPLWDALVTAENEEREALAAWRATEGEVTG